jgi:hypothetical protein
MTAQAISSHLNGSGYRPFRTPEEAADPIHYIDISVHLTQWRRPFRGRR